jgi:Zn-dependent protease with chaperone function
MNFFEAQDSARTRTRTLVLLFGAAVTAIIVSIYFVVHVALGPGPGGAIDPVLLLIVAAGTMGLVAAGSTARTLQLRQGGTRVAELLGGRRIRPNSSDEAERRLINVVEEMAIASGTPVPAIYVLDQEDGINAFAAGFTTDDAAVGVTRGTLDRLNRDELQGVIAHEFSHILNGDMRINIRLMGLLYGILLLAVVGRGLLYTGGRGGGRGGRRGGGGGGQIAIIGLALMLVGYIGVFFGRLIQAAVSRQREYLADAAAVQFTRNPSGIGGALQKIASASTSSRITDHHAQEAGHFFFANGIGSAFTSLLATHPPIKDRISRIDASILESRPGTATAAGRVAREASGREAGARHGHAPAAAAGLAGGLHAGGPAEPPGGPAQAASGAEPDPGVAGLAGVDGSALMASIGAPQPEHVAYAGRLLRGLPDAVRDAAHEPDRAIALLFALLLQPEAVDGARARTLVEAHGGARLFAEVQALLPHVRSAGPPARLPVLDMLLPALRELSPDQQQAVYTTARTLVAADNRVDMFELALMHVLGRHLPGAARARAGSESQGGRRLSALRDEAEVVLSAVAWSGSADEDAARRTFAAGAAAVQEQTGPLSMQRRDVVTLDRVDESLWRLRTAAHAARRAFLEACIFIVAEDGRIHSQEAEILRAVAEAIDCPMPPVAIG